MNKRLIGAGLLAGLVLNIGEALLHGVIFADASTEAMRSLGREMIASGSGMAQLVLVTFAQGFVGMLIYGAVQPKWNAGLGTAIRVGLILWLLSAVYSAIYLTAGFPGLISDALAWGPVGWEVVLYPLAIVAGSLIYKEK